MTPQANKTISIKLSKDVRESINAKRRLSLKEQEYGLIQSTNYAPNFAMSMKMGSENAYLGDGGYFGSKSSEFHMVTDSRAQSK